MKSGVLICLRLIGLIILMGGCSSGQAQGLAFRHFSIQDGLTNKRVSHIIRDRQGFVWLGSATGLNRFDGYQFQTYHHNPNDSTSLTSDFAYPEWEDQYGRIWIGTRGGGISIYDPELDHFVQIRAEEATIGALHSDYLSEIIQDSEGKMWIGTVDGVQYSSPDIQHPADLQWETFDLLNGESIVAIAEYPRGHFWFGSAKNGLYYWNPAVDTLQHYRYTNWTEGLSGNAIKTLLVSDHGGEEVLWVATLGGLNRVDRLPDGTFYSQRFSKGTGFDWVRIVHLSEDEQGRLWASTWGKGLYQLSEQQGEWQLIQSQHLPEDAESLSDNFVTYSTHDELGILWVATENGLDHLPLRSLEANRRAFHSTEKPNRNPQAGDSRAVISILEDSRKYLWLGSYGSGLVIQDANLKQAWYPNSLPPSRRLSHDIVTTLSQENDSVFWVGTFGGLNRVLFRPERAEEWFEVAQFLHEEDNPNSLSDHHIFAMYDEGAALWIGTRGGGLNRLDKKSRAITRFMQSDDGLQNNYIWCIISDGGDGLWIATDKGLHHLSLKTQVFHWWQHDPQDISSLSVDLLNVLKLDSKGRLWIGTSKGGLSMWENPDPEGEIELVHFREKDGLIDDEVYGILEDDLGRLWICTIKGISRLDPELALAHPEHMQAAFLNFDENDGLQGDEFNSGAYFQNQQGWMYFGGVLGYNRFHPDSIAERKGKAGLTLTNVRVLNELVRVGKPLENGNVPLRRSLASGGTLRLNHKDQVVSLEFSALMVPFPLQTEYSYQLEGVDPDWIYLGKDRKITYSSLPAGSFQFRVRASSQNGTQYEDELTVPVVVSPPPWKSWWAYGLYSLAALGLIFLWFQYRLGQQRQELMTQTRIERARSEEREEVRKHASADFHDELGNKMTRMGLLVELAKRKAQGQEGLQEDLSLIQEQAQSLSHGLRDFIWVLDPEQDSLFHLMERLKDFGEELFAFSETAFQMTSTKPGWKNLALAGQGRRHLVLLVKEALNNALKYSQATQVSVEVMADQQGLFLSIQDNGKGFDPELVRTGYGLRNMNDRAQKMDAEFELTTDLHAGTRIQVKIPLHRKPTNEQT